MVQCCRTTKLYGSGEDLRNELSAESDTKLTPVSGLELDCPGWNKSSYAGAASLGGDDVLPMIMVISMCVCLQR
jgi:hypothetical protein